MKPGGHEQPGRGFWAALVAGGVIMGWGAWLYLDATPDGARRFGFLRWLVGLDIAHDALLAPAVLLVGLACRRLVPPVWRAPVQGALIASGSVLIVAASPLRQTAEPTGNPTIQPLDYTTATLTVLAAVWGGALLWGLWRVRSWRGAAAPDGRRT